MAGMRSIIWVVLTAAALLRPGRADDERDAFFEAKVRPILVDHCWKCHGDEGEPEGDLRLTSREAILEGGASGPAAVSRSPENSALVQAIRYDGELQMPPSGKLPDAMIATLAQWIEMDLPWPAKPTANARPNAELIVTDADRQHWSFRPIADPPVPDVPDAPTDRSSIDAFVWEKQNAAQIPQAPPADRRTLIRRAYYDLIGLPPTYDEIQAFIADRSPDAYEKIIDRLLASPRYGERWGRHWLDVARYADTKDGVLMYGDARLRPYAYTYRDYVVRAFNEDLPYDQFIAQQLAADLIDPPVESWQLAALGFLTLGRQYDNNTHDVIDDQIDVTTRGFMGLTVSCARCHDHKYDPIPTADYYSMYGVMASCEVPAELPTIASDEASPEQDEFECSLYAKRNDFNKFIARQYAFLSDVARQRTGDYLVKIAAERQDPLENAVFFLSLAPEDLRPSIIIRWRRYLAEHATSDNPVFGPWYDLMKIEVPTAEPATTSFADQAAKILDKWSAVPAGTEVGQCNPLLLEALRAAPLANHADVARAYGKVLVDVYHQSKDESHLNRGPLSGLRPPSPQRSAGEKEHDLTSVTSASVPSPRASRGEGQGEGSSETNIDAAAREQLLSLLTSTSSPCYFPLSQTHRHTSRAETDQYWAKLAELDLMAATSPAARPRAMVVVDKPEPVQPRVFLRGNPTQLGRPVPRQFLAIAAASERRPFAAGSGRLELARAITDPNNPLTARVIVNRVWMFHFGEPLVSTPSDFGRRSSPPTHPELLDHLASQFVREGWSLKKLHRWIMLSQSYQMASQISDEASAAAREIDPENRLLWRMNRQRLDFESMRDTLLFVAGRLQEKSGGRPVDIIADPNAACRTVFGLVDRQSLPSDFRAFDFATPDQSIERRPRTMMPQQALFALNSPFAIAQAKAVIQRTDVAAKTESRERIQEIYRVVLARDPDEDELSACIAFLDVANSPQSLLSKWEQLAQVLTSCNELMYVD